jgi:hypothetical protein
MPSMNNAKPGRAVVGIVAFAALFWSILGSGPAEAAGRDRLLAGETLQAGQQISAGGDTLTMQAGGNLVLFAPGNTVIWASNTGGNNGAWLSLQGGSLAVIGTGGKTLWTAPAKTGNASVLILQPNGNAVVYAPGNVALWSTNTYKQTYADIQLTTHGWGATQARQFGCLNSIWVRESKWDELAGSPNANYGIPQADPGNKMAAEGPAWLTNPRTQIRWGEDYIQTQYGSPCQAWAHWQVYESY